MPVPSRLLAVAPEISRGRDAGLGGVADRGLQHLVGDRLGAGDQALQRGDAGVGGLQDLHAVADAVEQIGDVAGAVVQRRCGEEAGRVVQRGVDLVAGGEVVLRGGEQRSGGLQREQVLANRGRKNNTGHNF